MISTSLAYTIILGAFSAVIFALGYVFGEFKGVEEGKRRERELEDLRRGMRRES